ncbi:unnamed protein product [Psylliodes chrysocephalus]|uniref:Cilia- and flagella-associated protein 36 n=1 Tax=Psylliodes chrysocephalus TaxID=3402493 RepID=A0A9P0CXU1_9CUCU|nr:unnamed protein product [Psylliodes chrysocephala]
MEEDNSWVFDSLVTFLNGPIWNAPLQTFIEEKSLIFEPNAEDNEDYHKIFDEFKNLVDFMLGSFMEDIGITSEQFENACKESKRYQVAFDPNSFEQVWAANDYEMFKKMMTQRNVELQLQALELIEKKYGITPQSFVPKDRNENENIRQIPVTIEKPSSSALEKDVMEEVTKNFSNASEELPSAPMKVENILEEKQILEKSLEATKEKRIKPSVSFEEPQKTPEIVKISAPEVKKDEDGKKDNDSKKKEVDAIELKKRQEYLRAQRDKLVALKKEVRRKQLDDSSTTSSTSKSSARPKSAKNAEAVLTGEKPNAEPHQLQLRKTLAERLRAEVVASKE